MSAVTTYNREHILGVIQRYGISLRGCCLMDANYVYIDASAARTFYGQLAQQTMATLHGWRAEFSDCDKYSRLTQVLGQIAHTQQWPEKGSKPAGLAIGVMNYTRSVGGAHSINFLVVKEPGKDVFALRFFEPQTASEINLNEREIKSAFLLLL